MVGLEGIGEAGAVVGVTVAEEDALEGGRGGGGEGGTERERTGEKRRSDERKERVSFRCYREPTRVWIGCEYRREGGESSCRTTRGEEREERCGLGARGRAVGTSVSGGGRRGELNVVSFLPFSSHLYRSLVAAPGTDIDDSSLCIDR